jgi:hypothetical protein
MLLHPEQCRMFGDRGREIVMDRFTLDAMRSKRERLFADLLCPTG